MYKLSRQRHLFARAAMFAAAAIAPLILHSQSAPDAPLNNEQRISRVQQQRAVEAQRLAAIDKEIAINGPLSAELFELYFSLASYYREDENHLAAAETLEQALHIQRVTHGLFSLEQAAVTRELVASRLAAGEFDRAVQLEMQLIRIARENLDDIRSASILNAAADRQIAVYERYLDGDLPPQLSISFSSRPGARPGVNANRNIGLSNLYSARRRYFDAINVLMQAGGEADPRIVQMERKLIRSYFIEATSQDIRPGRGVGLFRLGIASYNRILRFAAENNDLIAATEGMIGMADWHLLFSRFGSALKIYADAHAALIRLGASAQLLQEVFSPAVPVALPTFNPNPLVVTELVTTDSATDFVDVRIKLSRYGRSRARNIETSASQSHRFVEQQVRRIITRNRFRPRLVDGEAQHGVEVQFRYYFDTEQT